MEEIDDADCTHAKRVLKILKQKWFGCSKQCIIAIEIFELEPACFLNALELAWQGTA